MKIYRHAAAVLCAALAASAAGGAIHVPRVSQPAVVLPGGSFSVSLEGEASLSLEGPGGAHALSVSGVQPRGARRDGTVTLPGGVVPGRYDLVARAGADQEVRRGAVHVLEAMPESYTIAVVRGMDGPEGGAPELPEGLSATLAGAGAALAIVFNAGPEGPSLESALLSLPVPVFVCAEGDEPVFALQFGPDGYLFLGGGLAARRGATHGRLGAAHQWRRALRASRWSIGVCQAYGLDWDVRAQMALFVDDPLDFLLADDAPEGLGGTVPWGRTEFVFSPEMPRGIVALLNVGGAGITPHVEPAPESSEGSAPVPDGQDQEAAPAAG